MRLDETRHQTLSGHLLLAEPGLRDPNFFRSVVLMVHHTQGDGAVGYVLTYPMGQTVGELTDHPELESLADLPVFIGGPVSPDHLSFVALAWDHERGELAMEARLSGPQAAARRAEGFLVRAFAGFSGWSEGQLESELEQGSWITCPAVADIMEADDPGMLWRRVMRSLGPYYHLLADMPPDVTLN